MGERYQIPKEAWFIPFGPVRGVDLIRVSALRKWREYTGALYSHGKQLVQIERMFELTEQVSSQIKPMNPGCTYFLHGQPESEKNSDKPGTIFVVRDGAIIAIAATNRMDWEKMPS